MVSQSDTDRASLPPDEGSPGHVDRDDDSGTIYQPSVGMPLESKADAIRGDQTQPKQTARRLASLVQSIVPRWRRAN
jgi:hypothetical protein